MLHHVQVGRDVGDVSPLNPLQHLVEEINISEDPADLPTGLLDDLLHEVGPVGEVGRDDDLVRVEESDVLVTVHVPVKAVVVRN